MKAVVWEDEALGAKYDDEEIPDDLKAKAAEYRHILIEAAVELDDDVMTAYLDGQEPDIDALKRSSARRSKQISFVPVLCGSAFKNKGVQPLLDAVVDYLPSPVDRGGIKGVDVETGNESSACRATTSLSRCSASRSWTIPLSARSPSAASIRARSSPAPPS